MSTRDELHEKTSAAKERQRAAQGATDKADPAWERIGDEFIASVFAAADMGEVKYFLDMKNRNQQTILKVSAEVKERLGDVLVIVSPRGIEANWAVSE